MRNIESVFDPQNDLYSQLELAPQQEYKLIDGCEVDQILLMLKEQAPNLLSGIPERLHYRTVMRSPEQAKEIGLSGINDLVLYNIISLSADKSFLEGYAWNELLRGVKSSPETFTGKVLELDIDDIGGVFV